MYTENMLNIKKYYKFLLVLLAPLALWALHEEKDGEVYSADYFKDIVTSDTAHAGHAGQGGPGGDGGSGDDAGDGGGGFINLD